MSSFTKVTRSINPERLSGGIAAVFCASALMLEPVVEGCSFHNRTTEFGRPPVVRAGVMKTKEGQMNQSRFYDFGRSNNCLAC